MLCTLIPELTSAQLNNKVFEDRFEIDTSRSKSLYTGIRTLGFFKNNEYSTDIADGFTLFGYQLNPYFSYYPAKNVRVDAGIYLQKDFGKSDFSEIAPFFTVKIKKNDFSLIFGNLEGSLNHRYIEPIYDFERVLNDRLENGLQGLWMTDKIFLDVWVNWETMIFRGDPFQEEISGGISFNHAVPLSDNIKLNLPIQFLAYHKGGQIDTSPDPLVTLINGALGGGIYYKMKNNTIIESLESENYFVFYADGSNTKLQVFEDGYGIYLNLSAQMKYNLNVMGSYWRGEEFIAVKGGQLYPSVSSSFKNQGVVEQIREILILRFLHDWHILDNLTFSTRIEPYYDFRNDLLEFSHGFYLNYHPDFFLWKNK